MSAVGERDKVKQGTKGVQECKADRRRFSTRVLEQVGSNACTLSPEQVHVQRAERDRVGEGRAVEGKQVETSKKLQQGKTRVTRGEQGENKRQ